MTKEEILAMEPGNELDTLVEEKLFDHRCELRWCNWLPEGWFEAQSYGGGREVISGGLLDENKILPCYKEGEKWTVVPFYSTGISAAWQVVEKVTQERHCHCGIDVYPGGLASVKFTKATGPFTPNEILGSAGIDKDVVAPEAICKAALLAKHS